MRRHYDATTIYKLCLCQVADCCTRWPSPRPPESVDAFSVVFESLVGSRRAGVPFPRAWRTALDLLPVPERQDDEHADDRRALSATRISWKRAYEREPAERGEVVVTQLLEAIRPEPSLNGREVGAGFEVVR